MFKIFIRYTWSPPTPSRGNPPYPPKGGDTPYPLKGDNPPNPPRKIFLHLLCEKINFDKIVFSYYKHEINMRYPFNKAWLRPTFNNLEKEMKERKIFLHLLYEKVNFDKIIFLIINLDMILKSIYKMLLYSCPTVTNTTIFYIYYNNSKL